MDQSQIDDRIMKLVIQLQTMDGEPFPILDELKRLDPNSNQNYANLLPERLQIQYRHLRKQKALSSARER